MCPAANSVGVRTSSTIVPGAFMAMEKAVASTCCPVAGEVELLSAALDEQALTPVVAATANAAAAIKRNQDRVGVHSHAFGSLGEQRGISEVGVDGLEREPPAGEVARQAVHPNL